MPYGAVARPAAVEAAVYSDGARLKQGGESKAPSGRGLYEPTANHRPKHDVLQPEGGDLRADRADRDEPGPDHDVAVSGKAEVDDADGGQQSRPGIAGGGDDRLGQVLRYDLRQLARHPAPPQHAQGDGQMTAA